MKQKWIQLSQRYKAALRKYVQLGPSQGLPLARGLGRQAAAVGLRALDLARMHDQALAQLELPITTKAIPDQADTFFARALVPMEQMSPSSRKAGARFQQLKRTLRRRTKELASSQQVRKQAVSDQSALKEALRSTREDYTNLLAESRDLQRSLQSLTRRMLLAQENERALISRALYDDVAQAMLGIQVRLAHLKKEAARNTMGVKKELTITKRLVKRSATALERFAGKLS